MVMFGISDVDQIVLDRLSKWHEHGREWARPMDIGGEDSSHHSRTLRKLARHGFVESEERPTMGNALSGRRPSRRYRLTPKGCGALEAERETGP